MPHLTPGRRALGSVASLLACLALVGCLSPDESRQVDAWLTCEDCLEGERDSLRAIGWRAIPYLGRALRGLPDAERENLRLQFGASYDRLSAAVRAGLSRPTYQDRFLAAADAGYRRQAAEGLAEVGSGGSVRRAASRWYLSRSLEWSGAADTLPDVARRAVHDARARLDYPPFGGALRDSTVAAFDTVVVLRGAGPPWDGDEDVMIPGARFADGISAPFSDGLVVRRSGDSLMMIAAAEPGRYALVVGNLGHAPQRLSQRVPLAVTSLRYVGHTMAGADPLQLGVDTVRFFALRPTAAADHFRLEPAVATNVMVTLDWAGAAPLALALIGCLTGDTLAAAPPAMSPRALAAALLPGCWYIGVRGVVPPGRVTVARLRVATP